MLDLIGILVFFGFFGFLIYAIATKPPKMTGAGAHAPPGTPPSPVGVYCSICNAYAATVTAAEYARIAQAQTPVYCPTCMSTIEIYERRVRKG